MLLVLEVEDGRRRGRRSTGGQHHAEREVDRVELVEAERLAAGGPGRAPPATSPPTRPGIERVARYSGTIVVGRPSAGVRGDRRHEDAVLELADARERAASAPARRSPSRRITPGDERQHRDPDHARTLRGASLQSRNAPAIKCAHGRERCQNPCGCRDFSSTWRALVERLREELAGGANGAEGAASAPRGPPSGRAAVGGHAPSGRSSAGPGSKGWVAYPVKKRAPAAAALVRRAAGARAADVQRRRAEAGRRDPRGGRPAASAPARTADAALAELEERLPRLERRGARRRARDRRRAARRGAVPDYFAFESRMRGSTGEVRERQRALRRRLPRRGAGARRRLRPRRVPLAAPRRRDRGARHRRRRRHGRVRARRGPRRRAGRRARRTSRRWPDGSLGGIFAAQVVEHLPPPALVRLLELAARKLRPGGVLVAETINPLSPLALRNYFADLTHAQPLVPETLALLAKQAGLPPRSRPAS